MSSPETILGEHFPTVSLSIITAILVGVGSILIKLRTIAKETRARRDTALTEKLEIKTLAEKLEFIIEQQNKKIQRLENIIFKLPNGNNTVKK